MTTPTGTKWRLLIVEDNPDIARQIKEASAGFVDAPDSIEADICTNFQEGLPLLIAQRYDFLILDLQLGEAEPEENEKSPGETLFDELKKLRFLPVVFYTAWPKRVRLDERTFVRIVEKTEGLTRLVEEVRRVMATQLPALSRHIDEVQRKYIWEFVDNHWQEFEKPEDQADLAYLLARRLALTLQRDARKLARKIAGRTIALADPRNVHPMDMYVRPALGPNLLAGDILRGEIRGETGYWLVLTPSCDFEQEGKLQNVLLAQCVPLISEVEYLEWLENSTNSSKLKCLIGDNREDMPPERFKFLPGTFFLPDSVVDFQRLQAIPSEESKKLEVIASLDSPFAEAVLARFSRYFGRLGTPDIDKTVVLKRLEALLKSGDSKNSIAENPQTASEN